jgi:hypothetical protein
MSCDSATIADGRAAWDRLKSRERKDWSDWIAVARALAAIRTTALAKAGANKPSGSKYNRIVAELLKEHGLDGINAQERYRALLILENLPAIQTWRNGLDDAQRRRLNHPNAIWHSWRKAARPERSPSPRVNVVNTNGKRPGNAKSVYWSQDMIRRAADAMRGSRSSDLFVLARLALEGAVRSRDDLLALLDEPDTPAFQAGTG